MEVFYNPNAIANIFPLIDVAEKHRVTMDTDNEKSINVHLGEDEFLKFLECQKGLNYLNTRDVKNNNSITPHSSFISTVSRNK